MQGVVGRVSTRDENLLDAHGDNLRDLAFGDLDRDVFWCIVV
ncbi:hypothetical protein LCGC14_1980910 [marine sediment metagenome]|uniref:Uncharacterized protein n=1 Tax=marine sediment metagenome TaxID=412755 RepID=A0A0F9HM81_9ZZZZ